MRTGDARTSGLWPQRRSSLSYLRDELLADPPPPEHSGASDAEFIVVSFNDLDKGVEIGVDFLGRGLRLR